MFAVSYAIQAIILTIMKFIGENIPIVRFISSNKKVTVFSKYFPMKHSKDEIKEQLMKKTNAGKRKAYVFRKANAVHIMEKLPMNITLRTMFEKIPKGIKNDMSDSMCIALCYVHDAIKSKKRKRKRKKVD